MRRTHMGWTLHASWLIPHREDIHLNNSTSGGVCNCTIPHYIFEHPNNMGVGICSSPWLLERPKIRTCSISLYWYRTCSPLFTSCVKQTVILRATLFTMFKTHFTHLTIRFSHSHDTPTLHSENAPRFIHFIIGTTINNNIYYRVYE